MIYEPGIFNTIQPTQYDESAGMILTPSNEVFMQNLRAAYAQDIVNLEFNPDSPQKYAITLADLQARVSVITYLMDASREARIEQESNSLQ